MEIKGLSISRQIRWRTRSDRLDLAIRDHDCLIITSWRACAVDYSHVGQDNHRSFNANELLAFSAGALGKKAR